MKRKKNELSHQQSSPQAVIDLDGLQKPVLPHFLLEGQLDSIPQINKSTLLDILDSKYNGRYDQQMIVDCRFEYEFEGGHIDGAVNYSNKDLLTSQLFHSSLSGKTLLIFYCEYSAYRAPMMARYVRQQDRTFNAEQYPKLTFPEVYILHTGYSGFFSEHRDRCFPQNYVEMDANEHAFTREREMGRLRQNRGKLIRAQTFAFGQGGEINNSPTANHRQRRADDTMILDSSLILFGSCVNAKHMAL